MYQDFGFSVYQDHLRAAEKRRKQNELIRAAEEYARRENSGKQNTFAQRVMQMFRMRSQSKQVANDARRAAAH